MFFVLKFTCAITCTYMCIFFTAYTAVHLCTHTYKLRRNKYNAEWYSVLKDFKHKGFNVEYSS